MNILYIGYWGANEGLSEATIYPHLLILANFDKVKELTYVSLERDSSQIFRVPKHKNLVHSPLQIIRTPFRFLNKLFELSYFGEKLVNIVKMNKIDLVICRSSLAGNYGLKIYKRLRVPFVVESFEPHSDYMAELKIWNRDGVSYRYQKRQENMQKRFAGHLYPVAENYRRKLLEEGVSHTKITTMPCGVDIEKFAYNSELRTSVRKKLGIPKGSVVGIYVGKFGGIYYSHDEAFDLFKASHVHFRDFRLILLTPENPELIKSAVAKTSFLAENMIVKCVNHEDVSGYLSAADLAFSFVKPTSQTPFCSPIKDGEYWAAGLPVMIPQGIGDDSSIIMTSKLGVIMEPGKFDKALTKVEKLIKRSALRQEIHHLAKTHRSFERVRDAYHSLVYG